MSHSDMVADANSVVPCAPYTWGTSRVETCTVGFANMPNCALSDLHMRPTEFTWLCSAQKPVEMHCGIHTCAQSA